MAARRQMLQACLVIALLTLSTPAQQPIPPKSVPPQQPPTKQPPSKQPRAKPSTKEIVFKGTITALEPEEGHIVTLKKNQAYSLSTDSPGFFTRVRIEDEQGKNLSNVATSSYFTPPGDGVYRMLVSSPGGSTGQYVLSVRPITFTQVKAGEVLDIGPDGLTVDAALTKDDPFDRVRKKQHCRLYDVKMHGGKTYVIDLMSKQFDAFLRLEDRAGKQLAQDDDSGGGNNARIRFKAPAAGVYRIVATSFNTATGLFVLKVREEVLATQQPLPATESPPGLTPPFQTLDLNLGEIQTVTLGSGKTARVKLVGLHEVRDNLRDAVRRAEVSLEVNGQNCALVSANYRLPTAVAGLRIDCPITKGYLLNGSETVAGSNPWGLDKDVRVRIWPAAGPLVNPGTFMYPAKQRWFASGTQMANEPVHVDGGENPLVRKIYYHYGLDIGGAEGLVEIVAATDGLVVSAGKAVLPGYKDSPVEPRYDVIYILDPRGWYCRYSHLHTIHPDIRPGQKVKMGQLLGLLGKQGGSGGWSHLHFDISARQPSGKWGIVEGYAFLWEGYLKQYQPRLLAIARPHQLASTGAKVELDGSRSWSAAGKIASYTWTFTDGSQATGPKPERTYKMPGIYSEVLKITDAAGQSDYDFAVVNVLDKNRPDRLPPSIHAAYYPTFGIRPGDPVTFLVRTFRTTDGKETWDFGDGSSKVEVQSDGNVVPLAKDGYARTVHRFAKAGHYVVRVERTNRYGLSAIGHVHVRVGPQ